MGCGAEQKPNTGMGRLHNTASELFPLPFYFFCEEK